MLCPNCRKEIPNDSSFCPVCGKAISNEQSPKTPPTFSESSTEKDVGAVAAPVYITKKSYFRPVLIACVTLAVCALTIWIVQGKDQIGTAKTQTTQSNTEHGVGTETESDEKGPKEIDGGIKPEVVYAQIIEDYTTAVNERWNDSQLESGGLNYLCRYYMDASQLGYVYSDIDHNGTTELLIGDCSDTSGFFFDLYTIVNNDAYLVISSGERDRYYLCEDGTISSEGSSNASDAFYSYYIIGRNGQLTLSEAIIYDELYSTENPWFYSTSGLTVESASAISQDVATQIMDKHVRSNLEWTPLASPATYSQEAKQDASSEPSIADQQNEFALATQTKEIDMDDLMSANILGDTFIDAVTNNWLEEWMFLYVHNSSDPETVYPAFWYDDSLGQWTYYGITYDEAAEYGWGNVWESVMEDAKS